MKTLIVVLAVVGLVGCSYNLALYPRGGGGTVAKGVGSSASKEMVVELNGETYRGRYVQATSVGLNFANTYGARPQFGSGWAVGSSNQYAATLTSANKALRCEFIAVSSGGNGLCVDSTNAVYDLVIERQ